MRLTLLSCLPCLQVSSAVNDATSRIDALLSSMDAVVLTLDHSSVSSVYSQGKSFLCCNLTNQVYTQWAATITVIALAWVAMQCALLVLSKLDTLSGVRLERQRWKSCNFVPSHCSKEHLFRGHVKTLQRSLYVACARLCPAAAPILHMLVCSDIVLKIVSCMSVCLLYACREMLSLQALPQQRLRSNLRPSQSQKGCSPAGCPYTPEGPQ